MILRTFCDGSSEYTSFSEPFAREFVGRFATLSGTPRSAKTTTENRNAGKPFFDRLLPHSSYSRNIFSIARSANLISLGWLFHGKLAFVRRAFDGYRHRLIYTVLRISAKAFQGCISQKLTIIFS
jgi:hypothetical protein